MTCLLRYLGISLSVGGWLLASSALKAAGSQYVPTENRTSLLSQASEVEASQHFERPAGRSSKQADILRPIGTALLLAAGGFAFDSHRQRRKLRDMQRTCSLGEGPFRQALMDAPLPMMVHAEDGEVLQVNAAWTDITGYRLRDIPTTHAWAALAYGDRAGEILETVIARKYSLDARWEEGEFTITTRDGQQRVWQFSTAPLGTLTDGRRTVVSMAADVTQRQQVEAALRGRESRFRSLFEQRAVGIAYATLEGRFITVNPCLCELLGYAREELLAKSVVEITHPDDRQRILPDNQRLFAGEIDNFCHEKRYLRKDGSYLWATTSVSIVRDDAGNPEYTLAVIRDVGDRKAAELALRENEERWSLAVSGSNDGIWDRSLVAETCYLSPRYLEIVGYDAEDLDTYEKWLAIIHPEDRDRAWETLQRHLQGEASQYACEYRVRGKDGDWKWLLARGKAVFNDAGIAVRVVGSITDICDRKRSEMALRESEARFSNLVENIPGAVYQYILHPDGSDAIAYMSPGCYDLWEVSPADVERSTAMLWEAIDPADLPAMKESIQESAQTLQPWQAEWRITTPSGQCKWLSAAARPERQANGDIVWDALILDASARKQAEADLRESEGRYRLLAQNTNDLVCLHEPDGRYLFVSPSCESLLGYHYRELLGRDPYEFCHPDDRDRVRLASHYLALTGASAPVTYRMRAKSGSYIWFETLATAIYDPQGQAIRLQTTSRDVTERVRAQEFLLYEARHDTLTGLPNRTLLLERLEACLQKQRDFALLFIDLDRFKVINDSLGHPSGDRVLVAVAQTLTSIARHADVAARLGGDEFVLLLMDAPNISSVMAIAARISRDLQTPIGLGDREVAIGVSIGIALGSNRYTCADDVLRDADLAMYRAKEESGPDHKIVVFNAEMHARALERLHLEGDLRSALQKQEFFVEYQPIVDLATGEVAHLEPLVRWQHPTRGRVSPGEFIPIAEETGAIVPLDRWVLETACQQLVTWQRHFPQIADLQMHVNLCARDLQAPDLLESVDRLLESLQLDGRFLTVEITERLLISDFERTIKLLGQLRDRNIGLSIDDFGTGYSSLAYLHQLPVNSLKIDRSFVSQMESDSRSREIIETIITLSNRLGIKAIAEGIETQQQRDLLTQLGCEFGQGYYFARPMAAEVLEAHLWELPNANASGSEIGGLQRAPKISFRSL